MSNSPAIYKNKETGKLEVEVPVTYEVCGVVSMEFDSIEDMNEKLSNSDVFEQMPLADEPEYIDGSYQINFDALECYVETFNEEPNKNEIFIDFKNLLSELETKKVKLCFLKDRGLYIEDDQNNLYQMEIERQGSYLNKLIEDGIAVNFHQVESLISKNIGDWEKEIWGVSEVEGFIKRQSL